MLPLLADLSEKREDFKFLTLSNASKSLLPCKAALDATRFQVLLTHQLSLPVLSNKSLESELSEDELNSLCVQLRPKAVIVGTNGKIQTQFLRLFPCAAKIAFVECYDYAPQHPSFEKVKRTCSAADKVLCPTKHIRKMLSSVLPATVKLEIVSKPSFDLLQLEFNAAKTRSAEIHSRLGLDATKTVYVFLAGQDAPGAEPHYEKVINPYFARIAQEFQRSGGQCIVQPAEVSKQKATTAELLSIADLLIGHNSSFLYEGVLLKVPVFYVNMVGYQIKDHHAVTRKYAGGHTIDGEVVKQHGCDADCFFYEQEVVKLGSLRIALHLIKKKNVRERQKIPSSSINAVRSLIDRSLEERTIKLTPLQAITLVFLAVNQMRITKS